MNNGQNQLKGKLFFDNGLQSYVVRPFGGFTQLVFVPENVVATTFKDSETKKWAQVMDGSTVTIQLTNGTGPRGLRLAGQMSFCALNEQPGASQPFIDRLLQGKRMFMAKNHARYWGEEGARDRQTVQHVRHTERVQNTVAPESSTISPRFQRPAASAFGARSFRSMTPMSGRSFGRFTNSRLNKQVVAAPVRKFSPRSANTQMTL